MSDQVQQVAAGPGGANGTVSRQTAEATLEWLAQQARANPPTPSNICTGCMTLSRGTAQCIYGDLFAFVAPLVGPGTLRHCLDAASTCLRCPRAYKATTAALHALTFAVSTMPVAATPPLCASFRRLKAKVVPVLVGPLDACHGTAASAWSTDVCHACDLARHWATVCAPRASLPLGRSIRHAVATVDTDTGAAFLVALASHRPATLFAEWNVVFGMDLRWPEASSSADVGQHRGLLQRQPTARLRRVLAALASTAAPFLLALGTSPARPRPASFTHTLWTLVHAWLTCLASDDHPDAAFAAARLLRALPAGSLAAGDVTDLLVTRVVTDDQTRWSDQQLELFAALGDAASFADPPTVAKAVAAASSLAKDLVAGAVAAPRAIYALSSLLHSALGPTLLSTNFDLFLSLPPALLSTSQGEQETRIGTGKLVVAMAAASTASNGATPPLWPRLLAQPQLIDLLVDDASPCARSAALSAVSELADHQVPARVLAPLVLGAVDVRNAEVAAAGARALAHLLSLPSYREDRLFLTDAGEVLLKVAEAMASAEVASADEWRRSADVDDRAAAAAAAAAKAAPPRSAAAVLTSADSLLAIDATPPTSVCPLCASPASVQAITVCGAIVWSLCAWLGHLPSTLDSDTASFPLLCRTVTLVRHLAADSSAALPREARLLAAGRRSSACRALAMLVCRADSVPLLAAANCTVADAVTTLIYSLCRAKSAKVRWNAAAGLASVVNAHGSGALLVPLASNLTSAAIAAALGDSHGKVRVGAARLLASLPATLVGAADAARVVCQMSSESPPCELTDSHRWALAHLLSLIPLPSTITMSPAATQRLVTLVDRELFAADGGPAERTHDAQLAAKALINGLEQFAEYKNVVRRLCSSLDVLLGAQQGATVESRRQ